MGPDDGAGDRPQDVDEGVDAEEAHASGVILPPLPAPPPLPPEPGSAPCLDTEVDPAPGVDVEALELLAQHATDEAHRLFAEAISTPPSEHGLHHERRPLEVCLAPNRTRRTACGGAPDAPYGRVPTSRLPEFI